MSALSGRSDSCPKQGNQNELQEAGFLHVFVVSLFLIFHSHAYWTLAPLERYKAHYDEACLPLRVTYHCPDIETQTTAASNHLQLSYCAPWWPARTPVALKCVGLRTPLHY